ncbi:MAG: hypothetical protein ACKVQS_09025 [Fimbriimonadaceae bacterium]
MSSIAKKSPAQPAVVLGLTLLFIAISFALPVELVPQAFLDTTFKNYSPDVLNVYACVAWAGLAHFLYAYWGQARAVGQSHESPVRFLVAEMIFLICLGLLFGTRQFFGLPQFGAIVWLYFIDHFIKAEQTFEGVKISEPYPWKRWLGLYQNLLSFGWLTIVLNNAWSILSYPWVNWIVSVLIGVIVLALGGLEKLRHGDPRGTLLSLFFIAEALIWGTVGVKAGEVFLNGVYVFHVAAGSYFHYLGSYFFAQSKMENGSLMIKTTSIVFVNVIIFAIGYCVAQFEQLSVLVPVFGIEWFTFWVGMHLVMSDLFPAIKAWKIAR